MQELAYALATAVAVLDTVRRSGEVSEADLRRGRRPHLVLRQCRHALRHRDLQDARLHRIVGRAHARALRRHRREVPPFPLRRAGEFARPHRAAAREQRLSHPASRCSPWCCRRTPAPAPCSCRPGTRRSACRGRWISNGRCACSRSWPTRPTCSNTATSSTAAAEIDAQGRGSSRREAKDELATHRRDGRRDRRGRVGYMKSRLVESNTRAARGDRARRADRRRRQQIHRERAVAARRRRPTRSWSSTRTCRGRAGRPARRVARGARRPRRSPPALRISARRQGRPQHHGAVDRRRQGRRDDRRMGRGACATSSANIARRPASRRRARQGADNLDPCARRSSASR